MSQGLGSTCPREVVLISRKPEKNAEENRAMKEKRKRMLHSDDGARSEESNCILQADVVSLERDTCAQIEPFLSFDVYFMDKSG